MKFVSFVAENLRANHENTKDCNVLKANAAKHEKEKWPEFRVFVFSCFRGSFFGSGLFRLGVGFDKRDGKN